MEVSFLGRLVKLNNFLCVIKEKEINPFIDHCVQFKYYVDNTTNYTKCNNYGIDVVFKIIELSMDIIQY